MTKTNQDYMDQLAHFLTVIPQKYIDALLVLHDKLDGNEIKWIVTGDLAERLRVVKVEPDSVEIVTSKDGAQKIFDAVQEFNPQPIQYLTQQLPRDAEIGGDQYPVFARSYYFEFKIKDVSVKVEGNLQFKVGNWEYGEVFDFEPEYVYVTGKKTAVTPLFIQYEFYQSLGWMDRTQKIAEILKPKAAK